MKTSLLTVPVYEFLTRLNTRIPKIIPEFLALVTRIWRLPEFNDASDTYLPSPFDIFRFYERLCKLEVVCNYLSTNKFPFNLYRPIEQSGKKKSCIILNALCRRIAECLLHTKAEI